MEKLGMLVLERRATDAVVDEDTIVIGKGDDAIKVVLLAIRGNKARIGVIAPKSVPVHRKEVYDAIARENRAATSVTPGDVAGAGKGAT